MDESSSQALLLPNGNYEATAFVNKFLSTMLKWVLKFVMWAAFITWLLIIFIYPLQSVETLVTDWTDKIRDSFLGYTGSVFLLFSGPVIIIALLSVVYLNLSSGEGEIQEITGPKRPSYRMWTFPVLVEGPLGVVSAAELVGILLFAVYILWVAGVYAVQKLSIIFVNTEFTTLLKWSWFFRMTARGFGLVGAFCLSFMFIPVSRGSVLLRLLNIPFEHAIRYHIWLGHLCMCLFTLHGSFYFIGWIMSGEIPSELISWTPTDGANLAGIINIFFGWSIWITSLPFVRPKNFELFYYTHHLYIIFIIFFAMHVGNFFFCIAAGSIFLFMIDRFLRFCQSRKTVDIVSTTYFPCGVVELVLSRPECLNYNALSAVFLRFRGISFMQWHPFSVSSSPLNGKNCISILIKACGDWTSRLKDHISEENEEQEQLNLHHSSKLTASIEGPYGHELPYQLEYENLVLVAGGIGISPFIAILSDVIYRIKQGKPCLPRNIILVWTMKRSNELSILSTIGMESIRSLPFDKLHLEMLIYVTQQLETVLENEIFGSISKLSGYVDVGVIVCGPPTLEASVATECRSLNMSRKSNDPIFHFNSNSFSL
ncbi:ferric-chelate reductase, putative [Ricinus communis]|uniref:Ferric-chelate reductase, putative n=1 Tax=Ricinus communis TaxID=3988 RepID=B9RPX3_RICCO|nr:ferric-chelate reductase, putative [Ricinus communis]